MTTQQQDLVFFKDNSLLSDAILRSATSSLSVISHVQGTSPSWLLNSLIENGLQGTAGLVNNDLQTRKSRRSEVFYVSFLHPKDFYVQNCKKNGVDLANSQNFHYIDCFTQLFSQQIRNPTSAKQDVAKLFEGIKSTVSGSSSSQKIVFIEAPEILLLSTNIEANDLLHHLIAINRECRHMVVTVAQDSPQLVDLHATIPEDPAFKVSDFIVKLYYRSQLNLNLQPLPTGRAKDITGCLTISRGTIPFESIIPDLKVIENEYIYHVTKDSNIKLFFR